METRCEGAALVVSGRLDSRTAGEAREAVYRHLQHSRGDVVVDLAETEAVDLVALRLLTVAARFAERQGRHVVLRGCPPAVRRELACRGWRRLFRFEDTPARV